MACRGVIFNMGGVLCETEPLIAQAAVELFRERYATEVDPAECRPLVGVGDRIYLTTLASNHHLTLADLDDDRRRFNEIYLRLMRGRLRPVHGAPELLNALASRGIRTAVATETDRDKMIPNLREIGLPAERFHAVVTGNDLAATGPTDRLYRLAAERLGFEPRDCLVIEDALVGVAAAKSAACHCLGLTTTFTDRELLDAGADFTSPDLNHLPEDALCW